MRQVKKPQEFEKFYFQYVGKGEACGCAERIIDVHEFQRLAGPRIRGLSAKRGFLSKLRRKLTGKA